MSTLFIDLQQINNLKPIIVAIRHIVTISEQKDGTFITLSNGKEIIVSDEAADILIEIAEIEITDIQEEVEQRAQASRD